VADKEKIEHWGKKVNSLTKEGDLKVGICWKSSYITNGRRQLYPNLNEFINLLKIKGISFFNANYTSSAQSELDELYSNTGLKIHNFPELDQKDDLDSTAAYLSNMDLIISVGTAVDELAAGLGVKTWKLYNFSAVNIGKLAKHGFEHQNVYRISKLHNQDWSVVFDVAKKHLTQYAETRIYPKPEA